VCISLEQGKAAYRYRGVAEVARLSMRRLESGNERLGKYMERPKSEVDEEAIALAEAALGHSFDGYRRDVETLRDLIEMRVAQIVEHHFGRLPQMLYRMDIPENKVDAAFAAAQSSDEVPGRLAQIIVERLKSISNARRACGDDP